MLSLCKLHGRSNRRTDKKTIPRLRTGCWGFRLSCSPPQDWKPDLGAENACGLEKPAAFVTLYPDDGKYYNISAPLAKVGLGAFLT